MGENLYSIEKFTLQFGSSNVKSSFETGHLPLAADKCYLVTQAAGAGAVTASVLIEETRWSVRQNKTLFSIRPVEQTAHGTGLLSQAVLNCV